ncbi:MAG: S8 family peptidase [Eubacterium sp.]|jgi:subtilisin family serine protease|nr:S8 family peptidase [Eubacterium sp.]
MGKWKRIMSVVLAVGLFHSILGGFGSEAKAQEAATEKSYVIVAENDKAYEEAVEEINADLTVETPVLSENNVLAARMTEREAEMLAKREDVLVEEDIILTGSGKTAETGNAYTLFEKKEELKRKKAEIYAEIEKEEQALEQEALEYEWNLQAIQADKAPAREDAGRQKVKVAVLDSGVDYVSGINLTGYVNFIEGEEELSPMFQDFSGHGTGIAGIVTGTGENGVYGVNPDVELYSVKVLDGDNKAPLSRIIRGIYWCMENDIDIINMSFGTTVCSQALKQAVSDAYAANILMVGAAGNGGGDVEYPAAFEEVMAVAATDAQAQMCDFSNTGEELDIAAPGEKIRTSGFFGGSVVTHGTSIAVPHVTGVASLLWEKDLSKSNEFIRQLISYSSRKIEGVNECGFLDAEYALEIYDEFSKNFKDGELDKDSEVAENLKSPETFDEVADDEAYAEGRWHTNNHGKMVENNNKDGLSTEVIAIVKEGAVYPDKSESGLKGSINNPWWHGRWIHPDGVSEVNYVAAVEMITFIATWGADELRACDRTYFDGMSNTVFNEIKADLLSIYANFGQILSGKNTKANRKYFMYGCGLHTLQDIFAHSTTRGDGVLIDHVENNDIDADNVNYYGRRDNVAAKATFYSLKMLKEDILTDGEEIIQALRSAYDTANFKIIKIKKYVNENGYSDPILSQVTISSPK